jgi:hypothetical protein
VRRLDISLALDPLHKICTNDISTAKITLLTGLLPVVATKAGGTPEIKKSNLP